MPDQLGLVCEAGEAGEQGQGPQQPVAHQARHSERGTNAAKDEMLERAIMLSLGRAAETGVGSAASELEQDAWMAMAIGNVRRVRAALGSADMHTVSDLSSRLPYKSCSRVTVPTRHCFATFGVQVTSHGADERADAVAQHRTTLTTGEEYGGGGNSDSFSDDDDSEFDFSSGSER